MELQDIKLAHCRARELKDPKLFERILKDLQKLSKEDAQNFFGAKLTRMGCDFMLERWEDLIEYSNGIIEGTPKEDPLAYRGLAHSLSSQGMNEESKTDLNDSLDIWPEDLETINLIESLSGSEIAEEAIAPTNTQKSGKVVYVDMDDVLCDFASEREKKQESEPDTKPPQNEPDFFRSLKPGKRAIHAQKEFRKEYEVYTPTTPSARNPESCYEKGIWVEKHLDLEYTKKPLPYTKKALMAGTCLIGDHANGKWQANPERTLVHFGTKQYPEWDTNPKRFKTRES